MTPKDPWTVSVRPRFAWGYFLVGLAALIAIIATICALSTIYKQPQSAEMTLPHGMAMTVAPA